MAAATTNRVSWPHGITSWLIPWSFNNSTRTAPNPIPSNTPRTEPSTATMTDSSVTMRRNWGRVIPTARSNPISRVRSITDRPSVLMIPSTEITTASARSA